MGGFGDYSQRQILAHLYESTERAIAPPSVLTSELVAVLVLEGMSALAKC